MSFLPPPLLLNASRADVHNECSGSLYIIRSDNFQAAHVGNTSSSRIIYYLQANSLLPRSRKKKKVAASLLMKWQLLFTAHPFNSELAWISQVFNLIRDSDDESIVFKRKKIPFPRRCVLFWRASRLGGAKRVTYSVCTALNCLKGYRSAVW